MTPSPDPDLAVRLAQWADDVGRRAAHREASSRIGDGSRLGRMRVIAHRVIASVRDDGVARTADLIASRIVARARRDAA